MKLYNDDCFNIFSKIKDKSIDLIILDLPYGQTACDWDVLIDLNKMWVEIKRIILDKGQIVFFCTTKFGYSLINSNPSWFRYDLIWKKSHSVGFLSANKKPLVQHEMIYIFSRDNSENDTEIKYNLELREYSKLIYKFINKSKKTINEDLGHEKAEHFFRFNSSQYQLCTNETYNDLIKHYKINEMKGFKKYDLLKMDKTYNPQKTKGKPYIIKNKGKIKIYNAKVYDSINETGDRHPLSILEFNNDKKAIHQTQKPIKLLEWIIKTYSNEKDLILDFTMGSGSCAIACINTNRDFIGVEKDKKIYDMAENRINAHLNTV